ncbi:Thioesterase superfamily protein [Oceanococcus atlanticus]|uniref:Thioesterase superfamily protein n=1 Tax=Oceanococcus atlanticus TaxID=1317117 RepID=A0A1Y1SBR1_9GAMM|nr:thioesterase family protein [Oceanococcus atlanticus]ORE86058.1 Thioesterase superfamily protein [Oceanococcus atlanticus]
MSRERSLRSNFDFAKSVEVRWGDMDTLGHVNNAKYLTYTESARIAFFDEVFAGDESFMNGQGPILAGISCNYHQQVHYPAMLEAAVGFKRMGTSSLVLACPIFLRGQDEAVADVETTLVWFDYRAQKPMPVPQRLRDRFGV